MAVANSLDKEINHYLSRLTSRQKKTVLTVVKTFVEEDEEEWWEDEELVAMLDNRTLEYESGKIEPLTREELEEHAVSSYKAKFQKDK